MEEREKVNIGTCLVRRGEGGNVVTGRLSSSLGGRRAGIDRIEGFTLDALKLWSHESSTEKLSLNLCSRP